MIIPILMYHSISSSKNGLSVSIDNFEKQMNYMKKNNYKSISFRNLNNLNDNHKYFIITFDDGYEDVYDNALPIMKKFGFHGICYFVTDLIGGHNIWDKNQQDYNELKLMNIEKIRSWINHGMDVGAHSTTHINLTNLDFFRKKIEIETPKKYFKDIFSLNIDSFSYPFGKFDDDCINLVKLNYNIGLTTLRSRFKTDKFSNFTLPRVPINQSTNIFKFFLKIKTPYEDLKYKNNVIL